MTLKRKWILAAVLVATFSLGFWAAFPFQYILVSVRSERELKQYRKTFQEIQGKFYGKNTFHSPGVDLAADASLNAFDPSSSRGSITLAAGGGFPPDEMVLQLGGDGSLYAERGNERKLVTRLDPARCKAFFHQILTSGIVSFSEDAVALKEDVMRPLLGATTRIDDAANITIRVFVPELGVDKTSSLDGNKAELKNFPGIVELKSFNDVEKAIFGLVPSGYPLWK